MQNIQVTASSSILEPHFKRNCIWKPEKHTWSRCQGDCMDVPRPWKCRGKYRQHHGYVFLCSKTIQTILRSHSGAHTPPEERIHLTRGQHRPRFTKTFANWNICIYQLHQYVWAGLLQRWSRQQKEHTNAFWALMRVWKMNHTKKQEHSYNLCWYKLE